MSQVVPTSEMDFLDQDPPLRGQNYVCLSFVSPEEVLKKKDLYFFGEFIKGISDDLSELFQGMSTKYPNETDSLRSIKERYAYLFNKENIQEEYGFFINKNGSDLEDAFYAQNNFQTSIRGIKVRGVFDTLREAEIRAQVLKKIDYKFNVYVAQVGCWCPWSPNPDDIDNQEFAESHLNTLMKNYKTNQDKKDAFYQERKRELQFEAVKKNVEKDAWLDKKEAEQQTQIIPEASPEVVPEASPEVAPEASPEVVPEASPEVAPEASPEVVPEGFARGCSLNV